MKNPVSRVMIERIPTYLSYLEDAQSAGVTQISATKIAEDLKLGEVSVRKDLGLISGAGKPRIGYRVSELIDHINSFLGNDDLTEAVIVGAGKIGCALLEYDGFEMYGVRITTAFDRDDGKLGSASHGGKRVLSMEVFGDYCRDHGVKLGIIAVPESAAQRVCDTMLEAGIEAIWNFSPVCLTVPEAYPIINERFAVSLNLLRQTIDDRHAGRHRLF